MPVIRSGPGYNGVTGAKATYNAAEDVWIDTNGERIRTDAIVPGEPPAKAGSSQPALSSPANPGTGGSETGGPGLPPPGSGGAGGAAVGGLRSALAGGGMSSGGAPSTVVQMGTPSQANPNLGQRNVPIAALKLALRQSQFGRVY